MLGWDAVEVCKNYIKLMRHDNLCFLHMYSTPVHVHVQLTVQFHHGKAAEYIQYMRGLAEILNDGRK